MTRISKQSFCMALRFLDRANMARKDVIIMPPVVFLGATARKLKNNKICDFTNKAENLAPGIKNIDSSRIQEGIKFLNDINGPTLQKSISWQQLQTLFPEYTLTENELDTAATVLPFKLQDTR